MSTTNAINFIDNKAASAKPGHYIEITLDVAKALQSWKSALYSFEWLTKDGEIKSLKQLSEAEQTKRRAVEDALKSGGPLEKPVLGIGMLDNVEIGSGRPVFLTLAAKGQTTIPVHIPKSCESDFKPFLASL